MCQETGVPASLERSRSGNGGHVWIFFASPIQAALARKLASAVLTRTMERRYAMGLNSYDRLFPSQDTMPKGGFGNLIALPLQHGPRENGNSVFVDDQLRAYDDQWTFLSSVKRLGPDEVQVLLRKVYPAGDVINIRHSASDYDEAMRLSTFGKPRVIGCAEDLLHHIALPRGLLKEVLDLFHSNRIAVDVTNHRFARLAR